MTTHTLLWIRRLMSGSLLFLSCACQDRSTTAQATQASVPRQEANHAIAQVKEVLTRISEENAEAEQMLLPTSTTTSKAQRWQQSGEAAPSQPTVIIAGTEDGKAVTQETHQTVAEALQSLDAPSHEESAATPVTEPHAAPAPSAPSVIVAGAGEPELPTPAVSPPQLPSSAEAGEATPEGSWEDVEAVAETVVAESSAQHALPTKQDKSLKSGKWLKVSGMEEQMETTSSR